MGYITLYFVALGLASDAFAVSVSNGICYKNAGFKEAFYTGLTFGAFQALMPLIGYLAGKTVSEAVEFIDHWIALAMLCFIGASMIVSAVKERKNPDRERCKTYCSTKDLMVQGVATSIDAFAVGISFAVIETNILLAVSLIGIITFICCVIGVRVGKRFGFVMKEKAEILGGCILIIIGFKIFIEHTIEI